MVYERLIYQALVRIAFVVLLNSVIVFAHAQEQRPNILIFMGDDMNWTDSEPYGNKDVITPNISKLANEGISLDNMFTSTAMCSPSRQQFYTGIYPVRNGAYPNHSRVYDSIKSVAHHFKALGYKVGLIGKKHYGPKESFPFEYFKGRHHDNGKGQDIDLSKINSFITENDKPYFLVISQNQPHTPWNRGGREAYDPEELNVPEYMVDTELTREKLVEYYSEITYADSLLGQCLEYVDQSGEADNTLVIFTSEQGSGFPFAKWTLYDLGIKTAFIARWPGKISPGTRNEALTQYVDVVPTLLTAAGADPDKVDTGVGTGAAGFDGINFLDVLLGTSEEHRDYVYGVQTTRGIGRGSACYPIRSVRSGKYKYIWNLHSEDPFYNLVTANPTSIFYHWLEVTKDEPVKHEWVKKYKFRPEEELYDLENDPFEMNNIAENPQFQEVKEKMHEQLILWMKSQGDQGEQTEMKALERQENNLSWQPYGGTNCNH